MPFSLRHFFPGFFEIGGFTSGLFKNGQPAMMGIFLILCGASINIRQVGMPLYKGVVLTGIKFVLGVAVGLSVGMFFGPEGIWGLSPIVLIAAITNSNGSLYISLSSQFGNSTDTGAISILSLNDGPFFTLIALGASGLANIPFMAVVATLIPLLIGFIWGNIDNTFRALCAKAQPVIIFFMTIAIGSGTDINTILVAGASGIILGLLSTLTAAVFFYIFNIFLPKRERNAMGAAIGTTALNSAMTPAAVADADPMFAPHVPLATAQCATASIITLFLCPFIVAFFDRQMRKNKLGIYSAEGWAGQKIAAEEAAVQKA
ncbi:2-keto-3-deoxygluconate permease [Necropsobacter rosorum]|uniref:2-keto-3-deoxygluconate permease n=1 Tax=Necropsobacter rosorum TaxID=908285 RepID=UPI000B26242A